MKYVEILNAVLTLLSCFEANGNSGRCGPPLVERLKAIYGIGRSGRGVGSLHSALRHFLLLRRHIGGAVAAKSSSSPKLHEYVQLYLRLYVSW